MLNELYLNVNVVIKGKLATAKIIYASLFCWTKFLIVVKIVVNSPFFYFSKKKLLQWAFFQKYHNILCCPSKILHKHCFQFLLGQLEVSREIENNAHAKF